ncbi:MAG: hypothetical protein K0U64_03020 [Actinomycetia bacterium]|nr:hypothetical protein [Actinomycetes bacterium]
MIAEKIGDVLGYLSGRLQIVRELELGEEDVRFIREMKYYTYSATKDAFSTPGRSVDTR